MSRVILVHGAFHNASCWDGLKAELEAGGHEVSAVDLPSHGSDSTPIETVVLSTYADKVVEELAKSDKPTVLIGHSMGGMVVTQAADTHLAKGGKLKQLIYIAAFVPRDGQSLVDLAGLPEGADDMVQANVQVSGEPPVGIMPADKAKEAFYGDCTPEVAAAAIAELGPQPILAFVMPVAITNDRDIRRSYVRTMKDKALPTALQARMAADNHITDVVEISSDHSPFLSHTKELAGILEELMS
jgi:pimeloyl-ACP methyl ester carboxylesterase